MIASHSSILANLMVWMWVYLQSRLTLIGLVGFRVYGWCVPARQGPSDSDLCISMRCVNSMSDDIVVFLSCILARQGQSESDLSISMRYVFFYVWWTCLGVGFWIGPFSLDRGRANAIYGFQWSVWIRCPLTSVHLPLMTLLPVPFFQISWCHPGPAGPQFTPPGGR